MRLAKGETKHIKVCVCNKQDGTNTHEEIDIAYTDVRAYLEDCGGGQDPLWKVTNIHYLNDIATGTVEHAVNVWVCGETVLYLPPPVMNLDPVHSATIAKTFGKRWEKEHKDTDKKRKLTPRRSRSQTTVQGRHVKKPRGLMSTIYGQRVMR